MWQELRDEARDHGINVSEPLEDQGRGVHGVHFGLLWVLLVVGLIAYAFSSSQGAEADALAVAIVAVPADSAATVSQQQIAFDYASQSLREFSAEPNSATLHRAACGLYHASLLDSLLEPGALIAMNLDQPDEYKARVMALVNHSLWFTDYCTSSPEFACAGYSFRSNPELLRNQRWELLDSTETTVVTWGQVVCLVMGTPYDPIYDLALAAPPQPARQDPEERPLFIGPKQS